MNIGDAYHYKLKFEETEAKYIRLKELYGQQQAIIEAYQKHCNHKPQMRLMRFGFDEEDTSVR